MAFELVKNLLGSVVSCYHPLTAVVGCSVLQSSLIVWK